MSCDCNTIHHPDGEAPKVTVTPEFFSGRSARETVLNQLKYISEEYRKLAKLLDATFSATKSVHGFVDTKIPDKYGLPTMMLQDGILSTIKNRIPLILQNVELADHFIKEADGEECIRYQPVIKTEKSENPPSEKDIEEFHLAIDRLMNARAAIQEFYDKFYPNKNYLVQMVLDIIDQQGNKDGTRLQFADLDIEGYLSKIIRQTMAEMVNEGKVVGLKDAGEEEGNANQDTTPESSS